MKEIRLGLVVLSLLGVALGPSLAAAQAYRWVDQQGKVHYSEGLDSVPSQHRATAKPIEFEKSPPPPPEKAEPEKKPATSGQPGEKPAEEKPAPSGEPGKAPEKPG